MLELNQEKGGERGGSYLEVEGVVGGWGWGGIDCQGEVVGVGGGADAHGQRQRGISHDKQITNNKNNQPYIRNTNNPDLQPNLRETTLINIPTTQISQKT